MLRDSPPGKSYLIFVSSEFPQTRIMNVKGTRMLQILPSTPLSREIVMEWLRGHPYISPEAPPGRSSAEIIDGIKEAVVKNKVRFSQHARMRMSQRTGDYLGLSELENILLQGQIKLLPSYAIRSGPPNTRKHKIAVEYDDESIELIVSLSRNGVLHIITVMVPDLPHKEDDETIIQSVKSSVREGHFLLLSNVTDSLEEMDIGEEEIVEILKGSIYRKSDYDHFNRQTMIWKYVVGGLYEERDFLFYVYFGEQLIISAIVELSPDRSDNELVFN